MFGMASNSLRPLIIMRNLLSSPPCRCFWGTLSLINVRLRSSQSRETSNPKTLSSKRIRSDPDSLFRFDEPFKDPFPRDFGFHHRFKFFQGGMFILVALHLFNCT